MTVAALLLILAFICFIIAAIGVAISRVNLIALGLSLVTLAQLLGSGVIH